MRHTVLVALVLFTGLTMADTAPESTTGEALKSFQGEWQAFDFQSKRLLYTMEFDETAFKAKTVDGGWYTGVIELWPDKKPARIDFNIIDCDCTSQGTSSHGIYYMEGDTIVIAAPVPDEKRPKKFIEESGQMMHLKRRP